MNEELRKRFESMSIQELELRLMEKSEYSDEAVKIMIDVFQHKKEGKSPKHKLQNKKLKRRNGIRISSILKILGGIWVAIFLGFFLMNIYKYGVYNVFQGGVSNDRELYDFTGSYT